MLLGAVNASDFCVPLGKFAFNILNKISSPSYHWSTLKVPLMNLIKDACAIHNLFPIFQTGHLSSARMPVADITVLASRLEDRTQVKGAGV